MSEAKNNKCKWLHLRLTNDEHNKIHKKFSASTCRKLSDSSSNIRSTKQVKMMVTGEILVKLVIDKNAKAMKFGGGKIHANVLSGYLHR